MPDESPIVTRFAPSPTGFLHIGGARTALFNWAFAQHHGGRFLLRIEDTDRKRSTPEAIDAILQGLDWLELDHDDAPIYQHENAERHRAVVEALLASGNAYPCTCTPEEVAVMRDRAKAEGRPMRYDGTCRARTEIPTDTPYVVRFKAPREGETIVDDQVQGRVVFDNAQFDDLILLRADGSPTYMLCVVADDYDMNVSHVIRGDDHLTNAARQMQIYAALDWNAPTFAHIPLIHGADGAKLSKRHGALSITAYRDEGYLPAAMRNYLARLGWAHGDDEVFTTAQLVEWFDLPAVGKSPARFDKDKLDNLNGHHIRMTDDDDLLAYICAADARFADATDILRRALPVLKERSASVHELAEGAVFLIAPRPLDIEEKAAAALDGTARAHLAALAPDLDALESWELDPLKEALTAFLARHDLKMKALAPALRAALTGRTISPGIYDVLHLLGKKEALARLAAHAGNPE